MLHEAKTRTELVDLLSRGKGIDVNTFDEVGLKSIDDLLKEWNERDVDLILNSRRELVRSAVSVKILIWCADFHLLETRRIYREGQVVEKLQEFTISETVKRGESLFKAAIRGLIEELNMFEFDLSKLKQAQQIYQDKDYHPSTVYPGVFSEVTSFRFELEVPKPFDLKLGRVVKDNGVETHLEWFPSHSGA